MAKQDYFLNDEQMVFKTTYHIMIFFWALFWGSLTIYFYRLDSFLQLLSLICLVFTIYALLYAIQCRLSTYLCVTNKRLFLRQGLIKHHTFDVFLPNLVGLEIERPLLGRLFDYGTVWIMGSDAAYKLWGIKSPLVLRAHIQDQVVPKADSDVDMSSHELDLPVAGVPLPKKPGLSMQDLEIDDNPNFNSGDSIPNQKE